MASQAELFKCSKANFHAYAKSIAMLDFNFHITTPRLYLAHLDPSNQKHLQMLWERFNHTEQMYFPRPDDFRFTLDDALNYIQGGMERMEQTGWGRYVILVRPEAELADGVEPSTPFAERSRDFDPIGIVSMQLDRFAGIQAPSIPDIGFGLLPRVYGRGYATEAAQGLMKYFSEERGIKAFAGFTDKWNEPAKKALRRLGMKEWGIGDMGGIAPGDEVYQCVVFTSGFEGGEDELEKMGIKLLKEE